jgi:hypothetical protein
MQRTSLCAAADAGHYAPLKRASPQSHTNGTRRNNCLARTKRVRLSRLLASSGPGQSFPVGITVAGSTISKTVRPCARGW